MFTETKYKEILEEAVQNAFKEYPISMYPSDHSETGYIDVNLNERAAYLEALNFMTEKILKNFS